MPCARGAAEPRDRCLPPEMINHFATIIIPGQSGTYLHMHGRVADLLADSGQSQRPPSEPAEKDGSERAGRGDYLGGY